MKRNPFPTIEYNTIQERDEISSISSIAELRTEVRYDGRRYICKELKELSDKDPVFKAILKQVNVCEKIINLNDSSMAGFFRRSGPYFIGFLGMLWVVITLALYFESQSWFPVKTGFSMLRDVMYALLFCSLIILLTTVYALSCHHTKYSSQAASMLREYLNMQNRGLFQQHGFQASVMQGSYDLLFYPQEDDMMDRVSELVIN